MHTQSRHKKTGCVHSYGHTETGSAPSQGTQRQDAHTVKAHKDMTSTHARGTQRLNAHTVKARTDMACTQLKCIKTGHAQS